MLYAIIAEDNEDSLDKRLAARPEHLKRLQALQDQGRLVLAGPHPKATTDQATEAGFTGSLIVAEFASLDDAQNWANDDPYKVAEVYCHVIVKPFKQVFP